ncbi:MAG: ATP-binding protein [bacterium]
MILRIFDNLEKEFRNNRVLIIYGARRTGKTTLLKKYLEGCSKKYLFETGENLRFSEIMRSMDVQKMKEMASEYEIVAIDEAQLIPDIGQSLKILIDHVPSTHFIATGSSSFDLNQKVGEPLTGRKRTILLFPLSQKELKNHFTSYELKENFEDFLIFGSYPEVVCAKTKAEKIEILQELANSYLLKDILAFDRVKSSKTLLNLLRLLAFQVGNQVSLNELATQLGIDIKTVDRYLDLLEKTFVIRKISAFSRNLRKEIVSKAKYFFLDNGVRNSLITRFNPILERDDMGALFENFMISERIKKLSYENFYGNLYFWRTYGGQEIDLIEEVDGLINGFEFKWGQKTPSAPPDWKKAYRKAGFNVINRENYLKFVL